MRLFGTVQKGMSDEEIAKYSGAIPELDKYLFTMKLLIQPGQHTDVNS